MEIEVEMKDRVVTPKIPNSRRSPAVRRNGPRALRCPSMVVVLLSVCTSAVLLVAAKIGPRPSLPSPASVTAQPSVVARDQAAPGTANRGSLIRKGGISPKLQLTLRVLGDRLERPGNERLVMLGTLSHSASLKAGPHTCRVITEFPHKMRLEEQFDGRLSVTTFNGNQSGSSGPAPDLSETTLIDSVVFAGIEHFFLGQSQGFATRYLGERFRLDEGNTSNYSDGFYDIYQVTDQFDFGKGMQEENKFFYFNSDTLLPERVRYIPTGTTESAGVEVRFGDWTKVNGQLVPFYIARFENGVKVMDIKISSATVGPRVTDSIFDRP